MKDNLIISKVKNSLHSVYEENPSLFTKNNGHGLCERCIVFRFAFYLQRNFKKYFVDCDYNSSFWSYYEKGILRTGENNAKHIRNVDGSFTKRYVDIIVHKRTNEDDSNLVCIELKKKGNSQGLKKDINNLKVLTESEYHYTLGLYIILGKNLSETKIRFFKNGQEIQAN